jgi:aspartyl-tRNA(Asn)/glutamyl-tRNA(Gln) amidotransferase subunit A
MSDAELCYLSIATLSGAYRARKLSPLEVTDAFLRRIEALDGQLRAYTTLLAEQAREAARQSEQRWANGAALGPLDGVPLALKDVFDTAGIRTTANSPLYADRVPETDAAVVARLRAGGAVILGKLAMYEFSLGVPELEGEFPASRNPWNLERIPGGSSSGSAAAVAAALCSGSFGSDTGGSVRGPASYCGIVGMKPTAGLVSRNGVVPLAWTLDQPGPLARTVEDTAMLLQAVAGYDADDPGSQQVAIPDYASELSGQIAGMRIAAPANFSPPHIALHPETQRVFGEALDVLRGLGAQVIDIELPKIVAMATEIVLIIGTCETFAMLEQDVRTRPHKLGRNFIGVPLAGALYTAADYIQALRGRTLICREMAKVMESFDLLALPTLSSPALAFADEPLRSSWRPTTLLRRLFSLTGQPAISVPAGMSDDGLPIGVQLAGRMFGERHLLAAAHAFEQATGWHRMRPPI